MNLHTFPVAVIMERLALDNKWCTEKWEAQGVIQDIFGDGAGERVIYEDDKRKQILFPGHSLTLHRDEAENYYLNLSSPEPKVFIMWRMEEGIARPRLVSVSYGEGAGWMDANENVDAVTLPSELMSWVGEFVEQNYRPEPKRKRQRT